MEPETSSNVAPSKLSYVFYNDRGLRAGWRLLIYFGMVFVLVFGAGLIAKRLGSASSKSAPSSDFARTILQAIGELVLFLVLLLLAWIMSKIEHRSVGSYGLPLQRSTISSFVRGYLFWGFLPLALLLLVLRTLHAFYFGNLTALNSQILGWGVLWFMFFLLVGLFEEFSLRGYLLYTLADGIGFWPGPSFRPYYLPGDIWAMAARPELESSQQAFLPCSQRPRFGALVVSGLRWVLTPAGTGDSRFSSV